MKKALKITFEIFLSAFLFFIVTMPFRELFKVIEVTEMRPASALPPVLSLLLGYPGALGCAVGNLVADILSGYELALCLTGFAAQFIYGIIPVFIWSKFKHSDTSLIIRLHNVKNIVRYIVIVLTDSAVIAILLGILMQIFGIGSFFSTVTLMLFLNNFVFCMVLGIPIIIFVTMRRLKNSHIGLTLNERFVLVFLLLGVISASIIGIFSYADLSNSIIDPLTMWNRIYFYIVTDLSIIYLVTIIFLLYAEKNITIPIETVARIAENYTDGGNEKRNSTDIKAECEPLCGIRNETGALAKAFMTMIMDLDTYIKNLTAFAAEKERIVAELNIAAKIQADMLPCIFPPFPEKKEFELFASMIPAKEVGGDFYDFFLVDNNHLGIVIADVSGKSVPAALFMVIAKTLINNRALENEAPQDVFTNVNNQLCKGNETAMFVTALFGILELNTGKFTYVNAGHNPPLLKKSNGKFEYLKSKKEFVLAGIENFQYKQLEITLSKSDTLFLYTDGVTEANNPADELYGNMRLLNTLNEYTALSPAELLPLVKADIDHFANGTPQFDDITMLAIKIK